MRDANQITINAIQKNIEKTLTTIEEVGVEPEEVNFLGGWRNIYVYCFRRDKFFRNYYRYKQK